VCAWLYTVDWEGISRDLRRCSPWFPSVIKFTFHRKLYELTWVYNFFIMHFYSLSDTSYYRCCGLVLFWTFQVCCRGKKTNHVISYILFLNSLLIPHLLPLLLHLLLFLTLFLFTFLISSLPSSSSSSSVPHFFLIPSLFSILLHVLLILFFYSSISLHPVLLFQCSGPHVYVFSV
jgi:hypothetical protein